MKPSYIFQNKRELEKHLPDFKPFTGMISGGMGESLPDGSLGFYVGSKDGFSVFVREWDEVSPETIESYYKRVKL
jgi:hypothetical protein